MAGDDALERATADFTDLLPDGRATVGHGCEPSLTRTASVSATPGSRSGAPLRAGRLHLRHRRRAAHRRRGHAQAALAEIEVFAGGHGCVGVQLPVFGANAGARALYRQAGYVETDVTMLKRVDG